MGACYGKGRGPKDPDKVPYEPTNGGKKKRQKSSDNVSDEGQPEDIDDKLEPTADDNANKETGDRTAVDQDKDDAIQEEIQGDVPSRISPVVLHLPPRHAEVHPTLPHQSGEKESPRNEQVKVETATRNVSPIKHDDVTINIAQEPPIRTESPWKRTSHPPKPYSSFTSTRLSTSPDTQLESKREVQGNQGVTVSVQRQSFNRETNTRISSENTKPFIANEPITEYTSEKMEHTSMSFSSVSKTTVIQCTDVDVQPNTSKKHVNTPEPIKETIPTTTATSAQRSVIQEKNEPNKQKPGTIPTTTATSAQRSVIQEKNEPNKQKPGTIPTTTATSAQRSVIPEKNEPNKQKPGTIPTTTAKLVQPSMIREKDELSKQEPRTIEIRKTISSSTTENATIAAPVSKVVEEKTPTITTPTKSPTKLAVTTKTTVQNNIPTDTQMEVKKVKLEVSVKDDKDEIATKHEIKRTSLSDISSDKPTLKIKEPSSPKTFSGIPSPTRTSGLPSPASRTPISAKKSTDTPDASKGPPPTTVSAPATRKMSPVASPSSPGKPGTMLSIDLKDKLKEVVRNGSSSSPEASPSLPIPTKEILKNGNIDHEQVPFGDITAVLDILCDCTKEREALLSSHKWCPNTRVRLMNCIDKWAIGEDKEKDGFKRVWAVIGKTGIGKTAIAANICTKHDKRLIGAHFFHHANPTMDYNDANFALMSLAFQMCTNLPNYASLLPDPKTLQELLNKDLTEIFDVLFSQPLSSAALNHKDETALLVIDAVDECNPQTRHQLLHLINSFSANTPDWLYLLVTAHSESQVMSQLDNLRTMEIKPTNDNMLDMKKYLKDPMARYMDRISLDGGLTQLVKKTDGSFLCARVIRGILEQFPAEKKIALREVDGLFPKGISSCYAAVFRSFKDKLSSLVPTKECDEKYQEIIGLLCTAMEPVHSDFLDSVLKIRSDIILHALKPVLDISDDGYFGIHHKHTVEWLLSEQESGEFYVKLEASQRRIAHWCSSFLENLRNKSEKSANKNILQYALKHVIWHLLDVPKQQNNVADLLCDLKYIQSKLQVPCAQLRHLLFDYQHIHHQGISRGQKLVSIADYMKKHPKLFEQMKVYEQFVTQLGTELQNYPDFIFHIAANYSGCERIQQNARVELEDNFWLEDRTALSDTHTISKSFVGQIQDIDLSPDGRTIAVITKSNNDLLLYLINVATYDKNVDAIDISSLKDRLGLGVKFLSDSSSVFVGSLTSFINVKQCKSIPSGFQASSIQVREKYVNECCDISKKFVVCGLSTLPGGGRSLHLAILDLKTKKCLKTIEVLKFRFGGSPQFGIKSCVISDDESMMCSLVKQSNKTQLVCTVWSLSKFTSLYTVDVDGDHFTRCLFAGSSYVLVGIGISSWVSTEQKPTPQEQSKIWKFKDDKLVTNWDDQEICSVMNTHRNGYINMKRCVPGKTVIVQIWPDKNVQKPAPEIHILRGLDCISDVVADGDRFIVVARNELKLYNVNDLEIGQQGQGSTALDVLVKSVTFHTRSEEVILAHVIPASPNVHISTMSPTSEDLNLTFSPLKDAELTLPSADIKKYFHTATSMVNTCQVNMDGNIVVFNNGRSITVWNRIDNSLGALSSSDEEKASEHGTSDSSVLLCVVSQKDNIVAVVHTGIPQRINIFDLKSHRRIRHVEVPETNTSVSDFTFMPSNGYLISFHESFNNSLCLWNQRNGNSVSKQEGLQVSYIRLSPASDRLIVSNQSSAGKGELILRNSDGKFSSKLKLDTSWLSPSDSSDVEFSPDGTILVGVCTATKVCRVWNAGNGEVLKDLPVTFNAVAEAIIGMITNTHVVLHDNCLRILDVSTGITVAVYPMDSAMVKKIHPTGMRVSPKGSVIIGANDLGQLKIMQCHNFTSIKRTTTLQRMKSFIK